MLIPEYNYSIVGQLCLQMLKLWNSLHYCFCLSNCRFSNKMFHVEGLFSNQSLVISANTYSSDVAVKCWICVGKLYCFEGTIKVDLYYVTPLQFLYALRGWATSLVPNMHRHLFPLWHFLKSIHLIFNLNIKNGGHTAQLSKNCAGSLPCIR